MQSHQTMKGEVKIICTIENEKNEEDGKWRKVLNK